MQFTYNENILDPAQLYIPIPPICSNRLEESYKSRRNKNKKNERIYEGWMRKVQSSDSSDIDESVKIKKQKKTTNNEKLHYLSLRLRKLNSSELILREKKRIDNEGKKSNIYSSISILDTKKKTDHECNKSEIRSEESAVNENTKTDNNNFQKSKINYQFNDDHKKTTTDYISPITGKYYDASLHKILHIPNETNEADKLNSVTVANSNFIPTKDYNWTINFQLMKREHKNFLESMSKAMSDVENKNLIMKYKNNNVTDFNKLKSEDSINTKYENNGFSNENPIQISLPSIVGTETANDEYLIANNIYPVKSKVIETISFKQIQGCSSSATNAHDFDIENNMEQGLSITTLPTDYDLNYINNHIDSFSSFITDTSFIVNRLGCNYEQGFTPCNCERVQ